MIAMSSPGSAGRAWERVPGKVTAHHRDRLAVVYVRQSTLRQMVENTESARMQYALVERAAGLGWSPSRVLVIDEDMGHSAGGGQDRPGFTRLVSEVGLGHVGVVLGIEMSRLARSGRDWHQLLELCALSGTLLADPDGVYDPGEHNDRLLLGLKGTISEAELYLIRQRMWGGRLAKARRGELAVEPPVGYLRRPSGEIVADPDAQVRSVVALVFAKFEELGTLHAVLAWLVVNGIQIGGRQRCGPDRGELVWHRPNRTILRNMIRSPVYAGIYAYGRKRSQFRDGRRRETVINDPGDWLVMLPDRLPAYISADQWRRNLAQLESNRQTAASPGSPRAGAALLSGLLECARCARRMAVGYHSEAGHSRYIYRCDWQSAHYGGRRCQQLAGACLDEYVSGLVLAAVAPASLHLSLAAAEQLERDRGALQALWAQRLERADYEVDRARRCYRLAEPENRLVVRQLEIEWEQALAAREQLRQEHQRFIAATPRVLTAAERAAIRALADDIPGLWHAPSTTTADRKNLIRLIIEKITVGVLGDSEQVEVTVTWAGGHTTHDQIIRPVASLEQLSYYPRLVARVRQLAQQGMTAKRIAEQINAEGFRPPKRHDQFGTQGMQELLRRLGLLRYPGRTGHPSNERLGAHEWRLPELAAQLNMPQVTLHTWLQRGWVQGRRDDTPQRAWILHVTPEQLELLRQRRQRANGYYTRHRFLDHQATPSSNDDTESGSP
jgi:DNA invertase Pin-like site-specific DNA recombinase